MPRAVFVLAALYPLLYLDRGWIPHDDGMLGQTALRVLTGELPHRDFADVYTGGLAYWNALSLVLFGTHLLAPRYLLFICYVGFLAATFGIVRRFLSAAGAAAVVVGITVWSVPNYPAAMPTWYNLFLAVAALWCFIRFTEKGGRVWLVGAGLACGLSLAMKSTGLYSVAALLMSLALHEVDHSAEGTPPASAPGAGLDTGYRVLLVGGMAAYAALVVLLVSSRWAPAEAVHFVLPSILAAGFVGWRVWSVPSRGSSGGRLALFLRLIVPFAVGVLVPVFLLAVPYLLSGSVGSLIQGVLVLPHRRLSFAAASPLPLALLLPVLPVLVLAVLAGVLKGRLRAVAITLLGVALAWVWLRGGSDTVYLSMWLGAVTSPVLAVLAGVFALARSAHKDGAGPSMAAGGAVVVMLATFVLVQYPFSGPIYFFYVAPLVLLAMAVALHSAGRSWQAPATVVLVFAVAFGLRWVSSASLMATAQGRYEERADTALLDIPRGHIRVTPGEKTEYETLVAVLQQRVGNNSVVYATPDTPETYFLSGMRNPTPTLYDFLDAPQGRTESILATLSRSDVQVVVLNRSPQFSGPPPPDLIEALEAGYPQGTTVGRFIVRWR